MVVVGESVKNEEHVEGGVLNNQQLVVAQTRERESVCVCVCVVHAHTHTHLSKPLIISRPPPSSSFFSCMRAGAGGYTTGPKEVIDLLRNRARPYLFSNTLPPAVVGATTKVKRKGQEE